MSDANKFLCLFIIVVTTILSINGEMSITDALIIHTILIVAREVGRLNLNERE